ncbi:MAG: FAD binding domain-containing protein [Vicinamibacterales bacterium]
MHPAGFDYYRARSIDEAHRLLKAHPGAKLLAGGHSLLPLMKLRLARPPAVVDIGRIGELRGIAVKGDTLRIGALTTHAELASSPDVARATPALAEAAALVGDQAVRNRGTIGGNVAHADPASDLPTVLVAGDARLVAVGPGGERTIEAGSFFKGLMETALADDEVLTAVLLPALKPGEGAAYVKFSHPASRYAVVGAAAIIAARGGTCESARVAVGGLVPRAIRATSVESALAGQRLSPDSIEKAAGQVARDLGDDVLGDIFASAEYRRSMAAVFVKRAITAAGDRSRH